MQQQGHYDIFISYRRQGGSAYAQLLYERLTRMGYSVFYDVISIKQGKFDEAIYKRIESAKDIVVILTPGALDRCRNEDDWVRAEICHAIGHRKNIIPLMADGFCFPKEEDLPEVIRPMARYNGVELPSMPYLDTAIKLLCAKFLTKEPDPIPDPKPKHAPTPKSDSTLELKRKLATPTLLLLSCLILLSLTAGLIFGFTSYKYVECSNPYYCPIPMEEHIGCSCGDPYCPIVYHYSNSSEEVICCMIVLAVAIMGLFLIRVKNLSYSVFLTLLCCTVGILPYTVYLFTQIGEALRNRERWKEELKTAESRQG